MFNLLIFVIVSLNLVVSLFGIYAIHRNKDAWSYGSQKIAQVEKTVSDQVSNVVK